MAARTRKIIHDDETRSKIQAANIIHRMQQCIDGKIILDAQQVSCAKGLLNKVLPDLQATALSGTANFTAKLIITGVPRVTDNT